MGFRMFAQPAVVDGGIVLEVEDGEGAVVEEAEHDEGAVVEEAEDDEGAVVEEAEDDEGAAAVEAEYDERAAAAEAEHEGDPSGSREQILAAYRNAHAGRIREAIREAYRAEGKSPPNQMVVEFRRKARFEFNCLPVPMQESYAEYVDESRKGEQFDCSVVG